MLEQTGGPFLAPRVQLTHSSVHRAQFGGPVWTETSFGIALGAGRDGMASSAAVPALQPEMTIVSATASRATKT